MNSKLHIAAAGGLLGYLINMLFGGWSDLLTTLIIFMIIDYVTGILLAAVFNKSTKTKGGGLSSAVGLKGIVKKVAELALAAVAYRLELATGVGIMSLVVGALIATEAMSIMENTGRMGILPERVQRIFTKAIDFLDGEEKREDKKNDKGD